MKMSASGSSSSSSSGSGGSSLRLGGDQVAARRAEPPAYVRVMVTTSIDDAAPLPDLLLRVFAPPSHIIRAD